MALTIFVISLSLSSFKVRIMKFFITFCFFVIANSSVNSQINFRIPDLTVHDSLGVESNLIDLSFNEDRNATLYYYWAFWCSPCRDKIEEIRPYAQEWLENYNVNIKLIVYDRQMLSDSSTSVNYYRTHNLNEIGDLYFVHDTDAEEAFDDEDFPISPFALSFLHRHVDRKLLIFSGASAEEYDETIKDFFEPSNTSTTNMEVTNLSVDQDEENLKVILSETPIENIISIYNTMGQLITTQSISQFKTEYHFSKSPFERNQIYYITIGRNRNAIPCFVY